MIKKIKYTGLLAILFLGTAVFAQNTTNSPYSQFGLGDLKPQLTPQFLGMGGVSQAVRKPNGYNNVNAANPAAYSAIELSAFDIGGVLDFRKLSKGSGSERTSNGTLSHLLIGVPVSKGSALSFGLMPYSDLGYQYRTHTTVDTLKVDRVYSGEGGLSTAHLGYGFKIGQSLSLGFNVSYIFGNLKTKQSAEFIEDPIALNSRVQSERSVGGLNLHYGIQYVINPQGKNKLTLGYSAKTSSRLNTSGSTYQYRYTYDQVTETESAPIDTLFSDPATNSKISIPQRHSFGIAFERENKWIVGADFNYSKWSAFTDGGASADLNDTFGFAVGGSYTPDLSSVTNYFKLVDYSLGFKYDRTYIKISGQEINQSAVCVGLGLPLPSNRTAFYKINFSAEIGKRGNLSNSLIRENYINMRLGFTLNDRWFIKPKYD